MIWAFKCASIMDHDHGAGYQKYLMGTPTEFAFVLAQNKIESVALPFVIFQERPGEIGAVDSAFMLEDPVAAGRASTMADEPNFKKIAINYYQPVLKALSMLARGAVYLQESPVTMWTRKEREMRARAGAPKSYKILRGT
jgi:hypothetical protein